MTPHLFIVSIGPVQGFISASRRTRDLWFGSHLLAKISQAAAQAVHDAGGQLIFPVPEALAKSEKEGAQCNIANVLLAELPPDVVPKDVMEAAEKAAKCCWKGYAKAAYDTARKLINPAIWNEQLEDVIEFYAAWVTLPSPDRYADIRKQLMRLLAGRKACRNFLQVQGHAGVPKSSLDGARESVFIPRKRRHDILKEDKKLAQRLRLSRGEELDAVGLIKRAATKEAFSSVVRVAADPWIRGIEKDGGEAKTQLEAIAKECAKVTDYKSEEAAHVTGTGVHYRETIFPYDGAVLFPPRLNSFLRLREDEVDILTDKDHKIFKTIRDKLLPKLQTDYGYSEPEPYLVVLCADGDRMGQALSNIDLSEKHRKFSRQLTEFAGKARELVRKHSGCLIYSGGDDVLAFVPADKSLGCARELHDEFGKLLETWKDKEGKSPTLSVGLAIGHCLEHLEDLLNYARAAEKAAKEPDRDGLAVHLHPRGGPPVKVRGQWTDKLDERLLRWAGMHLNEQISDKTVYDLRMLARDYASWPDTVETDKAIEKDIQRLLSRKQADGHKPDTAAFAQDIERCFQRNRDESHRDYHPGVMQLAEEWLIARRLAKVMRQAREKNALSDEVRK